MIDTNHWASQMSPILFIHTYSIIHLPSFSNQLANLILYMMLSNQQLSKRKRNQRSFKRLTTDAKQRGFTTILTVTIDRTTATDNATSFGSTHHREKK